MYHARPRKRDLTLIRHNPTSAYSKVLARAIRAADLPDQKLLLGRLRAKDFKFLLEWSERVSPQLYDSRTVYFVHAQIAALIKKYPFTPTQVPGINPESVAWRKFASA